MKPITGDPQRVRSEGQRLVAAADRMSGAARALRRLGNHGSHRSDAVDALRGNARAMAEVVASAEERYRAAGEALLGYAPALDAAISQGNTALADHGSTDVARTGLAALEAAAYTKARELQPWVSEEERAEDRVSERRAAAVHAAERAAAAAARGRYEQARADLEAAANVAIARINSGIRTSQLNDRFGDKAKDVWKTVNIVYEEVLTAAVKVIEVASQVLTVVAIVAAFVPGGQVVALAALGVSRILNVASAVLNVLSFLDGRISAGDFLFGLAFGLALGGLGKGASGVTGKVMGKKKPEADPPKDWIEGMSVQDGARYTKTRFQHGHIQWEDGSKAVLDWGDGEVKSAVKGAVVGAVKDAVYDQARMMVPDQVWDATVPQLEDHLGPQTVGTDFSGVDASQIVAQAFSSPVTAELVPAGRQVEF